MEDGYGLTEIAALPVWYRHAGKRLFRLERIPARHDDRAPVLSLHLLFARLQGERVPHAPFWALACTREGPGGMEEEAARGVPARPGAGSHESGGPSWPSPATSVPGRNSDATSPKVVDIVHLECIAGVDLVNDGTEDLRTPVVPFARPRAVFGTGNREHRSDAEPSRARSPGRMRPPWA